MNQVNDVTARIRRFANALTAMLLVVCAPPSQATTLPFEYGAFRSVCTWVQISADSEVESRFALTEINKEVGAAVEQRLRALGLSYPVLTGPACFRERAAAPQQLSLWFYARAVYDPDHPRRLVLSLVMHSHYDDRNARGPYHADIPKSHHEFPTEVSFCLSDADPSRCLTDRVVHYFDATMLKVVERAQQLLKGGRQ